MTGDTIKRQRRFIGLDVAVSGAALALCLTIGVLAWRWCHEGVTKQNYEKIVKGMSFNQVRSILGEGADMPTDVEDQRIVHWRRNDSPHFISVFFRNGTADSKCCGIANDFGAADIFAWDNWRASRSNFEKVCLGSTPDQVRDIMGHPGAFDVGRDKADEFAEIWYSNEMPEVYHVIFRQRAGEVIVVGKSIDLGQAPALEWKP